MKSKSLFTAVMVLAAPALVFAAPKNSANLNLDHPVNVAGTQLAPGQYKLIWEGTGPDVTISFTEGKKTVTTAPAKLVSNQTGEEAYETFTAADKTTVLRAVDLKKFSIQFENAAPGAGN